MEARGKSETVACGLTLAGAIRSDEQANESRYRSFAASNAHAGWVVLAVPGSETGSRHSGRCCEYNCSPSVGLALVIGKSG